MFFNSNDLYTGNEYFKNKPNWDDEYSEWKAQMINQLLHTNNINPEKIIEVGCGAGGILQGLSTRNPSINSLSGFDISPHAIALAKKKETNKIKFFNTDFLFDETDNADVLLVIDVVEHVGDYYGFLDKLKSRSKYFVFHIPLDMSCRNLLKPHTIKQQRDSVGHIHYFTRDTIEWALKDTGYLILDWFYTKPLIDTEQAKTIKGGIKKFLRKISFSLNKNQSARLWGGYSMMILAR